MIAVISRGSGWACSAGWDCGAVYLLLRGFLLGLLRFRFWMIRFGALWLAFVCGLGLGRLRLGRLGVLLLQV